MTGRADTNKSCLKGNIGRLEEWGKRQPTRRRVIAGVTIRPYFTAWQKCHKPALKNFDFDKFTVFFTVFRNLLKI